MGGRLAHKLRWQGLHVSVASVPSHLSADDPIHCAHNGRQSRAAVLKAKGQQILYSQAVWTRLLQIRIKRFRLYRVFVLAWKVQLTGLCCYQLKLPVRPKCRENIFCASLVPRQVGCGWDPVCGRAFIGPNLSGPAHTQH